MVFFIYYDKNIKKVNKFNIQKYYANNIINILKYKKYYKY